MASIASQVLGYLKRTMTSLVEPLEKNGKDNLAKQRALQPTPDCERSQLEVHAVKRKISFSPNPETKRQKSEDSGTTVVCSRELYLDIQESTRSQGSQSTQASENGSEENKENSLITLNTIFNQLMWTLKYLKFNPNKSSKEIMGMIETLCDGLEKIISLSRFDFTDQEFRRSLRITNGLFSLINSCAEETSMLVTRRINLRVDTLFDNCLDRFTDDESDAEGHYKTYGFINALISQIKDEQFVKMLVEKIILRLYATTTALWKACVYCENGSVELVHPGDLNLFFFYCQLLEVLITCVPSDTQTTLQESVHRKLKIMEEDAGLLFLMLPNLTFILYSTILSSGQSSSKTSVSPLKEIQDI